MDYSELLTYLDLHWQKTTLGRSVDNFPFDDLRQLLSRLDISTSESVYLGVTGTKGKGSIAYLAAEILQHHGLRVGLFTSPHLIDVEERVQIDGSSLDRADFALRFSRALAAQRAASLQSLGITPLLLALALRAFGDAGVNVAVLEVRTGGRFDPTNVVDASAVCLGPIGLEHVPGLGYSLADIAWQKVGLVKPNVPCFSAEQPAEAATVVELECAANSSPLSALGRDMFYRVHDRSETSQRIDLMTPENAYTSVQLALLGEHQAANAALALSAAEFLLARRGQPVLRHALDSALAGASWPARLERVSGTPLVLYDGAHTPESAGALARALTDHFPDRRWTVVLGMLAGKNALALLAALRPIAERVICVPVDGFSYQPPESLASTARQLGFTAQTATSIGEAFARTNPSDPICVTGTLYLYAATLEVVGARRPARR